MVQHKMYRNQTKPIEGDTSPANPRHRQSSFFQLTGHKECFKPGNQPNTILKRSTGNEQECLNELMNDELANFVPQVFGTTVTGNLDNLQQQPLQLEQQNHEQSSYLEMQDLLTSFRQASVMDIKMGCRTYREQELDSASREAKLRHDMYEKMVEVDECEPTAQEKEARAITKPRYMIWRETVSSTASLSFRIEGMRLSDGTIDKNFKTIKDEDQIAKALMRYAKSTKIRLKYLERLHDLRKALIKSKFFSTHEMIGSSLLFVHDDCNASIWMIDFAKTYRLPEDTEVTHSKDWRVGNHEDGYLTGVDNLIRIFEAIVAHSTSDQNESSLVRIQSTNQQSKFHEENTTINNNKINNKLTQTTTKHHPTQLLKKAVNINGSNGSLNTTTRFLPKLKT